jgi:hypothetical protein
MYGIQTTEQMNLEELHALERYLEIWMCNIRSAKVSHNLFILISESSNMQNT